CNDNGICEPGLGETIGNCPIDCGVATTTPTTTPPETTPPSQTGFPGQPGGGTGFPVPIILVSVSPGERSVVITWESPLPTLSTFGWGLTSDYRSGTLSEASYGYTHSITLDNLEPQTTYQFEILPKRTDGLTLQPYFGSFTTLGITVGTYPSNVLNFTALG